MFVLKLVDKPEYAKKYSDDFYYRDRGRRDCEGPHGATKFESEEEAYECQSRLGDGYKVVEIE